MSPKQKAVILTDLLALQKLTMEKILFYENEAERYRKTFRELTNRIMGTGRIHDGKRKRLTGL